MIRFWAARYLVEIIILLLIWIVGIAFAVWINWRNRR